MQFIEDLSSVSSESNILSNLSPVCTVYENTCVFICAREKEKFKVFRPETSLELVHFVRVSTAFVKLP